MNKIPELIRNSKSKPNCWYKKHNSRRSKTKYARGALKTLFHIILFLFFDKKQRGN